MNIPPKSYENAAENIVIYHALLIGASPLIPILFVDEMIAGFFWRHMVSNLAKYNKIELTKSQVVDFANQNSTGCSSGCSFVFTYPIKEFIREILFWLEIRRGITLATHAFYAGYLLNIIFQLEDFNPVNASKYSKVMASVIRGINGKIVKDVFENTFKSSLGKLKEVSSQLKTLGGTIKRKKKARRHSVIARLKYWFSKPNQPLEEMFFEDEEVDQEFRKEENKVKQPLRDLVRKISDGLSDLRADHLDSLRMRLIEELQKEALMNTSGDRSM